MKFRPLHDWVVIRRNKAAEMTSSGIIIPDTARDKQAEGIVEAVGPGKYKQEKEKKEKKFFPTVLKQGQQVMFIDYMARDVKLDGTEITLIREEDILGLIERGGELAVKDPYDVEIKKDRPPMVQTPLKKVKAAAGPTKPVKTKKAKPAVAEVMITATKSTKKEKEGASKKTAKKAVAQKTVKKAVAKKTAPKKTVKKTTQKTKK
jgi:chaperonin GroES